MRFLLLLFVPAIFGFDSSFNYGCQNGKCTFQLVVPKEVAQYIDENTLGKEVSSIATSLQTLTTTIKNFDDKGATNFTDVFNGNYTIVEKSAQNLNSTVSVSTQNSTDLVTASANAAILAHLLYNSTDCFQKNINSSYTCFTLPTTVAPPTTQSVSSTVNPVTVSQGSQPTGGSTNAPISTNAPASDSSSPSTSARPSSATDSPSSAASEVISTGASTVSRTSSE